MIYAYWLAGIALFFVAAERLWPRERQAFWRPRAWSDLAYLVFNSEYAGLLTGLVAGRLFAAFGRPAGLP